MPVGVPPDPDNVYKGNGWNNWSIFLGNTLPFHEARAYVRSLGVESSTQWVKKYAKSKNLPDNIPKTPNIAYKNAGWISWGDFLGF